MANRLTLYFTSDTHGYIYPTDFISPGTLAQGLLRMRFPKDGNTLVIDGGDTLQGSPLTYYCHAKGIEMPCAAVMNDLGYDYITLGNHD
ncbi:MAG: bifunctional metallophosphatase/5'-nucleotidase, partial [Bacillota bacterium]